MIQGFVRLLEVALGPLILAISYIWDARVKPLLGLPAG